MNLTSLAFKAVTAVAVIGAAACLWHTQNWEPWTLVTPLMMVPPGLAGWGVIAALKSPAPPAPK
jgi:hypothetical protein